MIIYVSSEKSKGGAARFLSGGSVYDKLKTDFNLKKDKCLQIKLASSEKDNDQWDELIERMRDAILNSFTNQVFFYEEEAMKMERIKNTPNWSYCHYFLVKVPI